MCDSGRTTRRALYKNVQEKRSSADFSPIPLFKCFKYTYRYAKKLSLDLFYFDAASHRIERSSPRFTGVGTAAFNVIYSLYRREYVARALHISICAPFFGMGSK